jgi:hypothetical protein
MFQHRLHAVGHVDEDGDQECTPWQTRHAHQGILEPVCRGSPRAADVGQDRDGRGLVALVGGDAQDGRLQAHLTRLTRRVELTLVRRRRCHLDTRDAGDPAVGRHQEIDCGGRLR